MNDEYSERDDIRDHYDRLSGAYRTFWGDHLHHGYWEAGEELSQSVAQVRLIEQLAARAGIAAGSRVLDIGCGLGGSSRWLAQNLDCSVMGITLSPVQVEIATLAARKVGLGGRVRFEVRDANQLDLPPASFDAVWVVECSEHLPDKREFIESCARVLRPGGSLALCAWLRSDVLSEPDEQLVQQVCEGMLCPSLGSLSEYVAWMDKAGFDRIEAEDITPRVAQTWTRCAALLNRPEVKALLRVSDARLHRFAESFAAMSRAYETGAMGYGIFAARKREAATSDVLGCNQYAARFNERSIEPIQIGGERVFQRALSGTLKPMP